MKTALVLLFIFGAAFAAPAEDQKKAPEAAVVKEGEAAAPEVENKMMKKEEELPVPENSIIVPENAPVLKEAEGLESRQTCPTGWVNFQKRCYLYVPFHAQWPDAERHCNVFGAHLTSATSVSEYTFLQQLTSNAGQTIAWLGGYYLSEWMWVNNEVSHYTYWDRQSSFSDSSCIYLQTDAGWRNTYCSGGYHFICSSKSTY